MAALLQLPPDDDPGDAYRLGKREWGDRYANLAAAKRNWQFAALGFFLLAVLTSTIAIIQVRQVKQLPYVVEADPLTGYVITMPQPLTASTTTISMEVIEQATVDQFIMDARSAVNDFAAEDALLHFVNDHAHGPAQGFLKQYYEDHVRNPHVVALKHSITVTIESRVPIGPHSWQVRFIESYKDNNGLRIESEPDTHWVALLHTEVHPGAGSLNYAGPVRNPAGVYIVGLQWAPEQLPEVRAR
jgi:type IV secretory pathway TrbF-like protein